MKNIKLPFGGTKLNKKQYKIVGTVAVLMIVLLMSLFLIKQDKQQATRLDKSNLSASLDKVYAEKDCHEFLNSANDVNPADYNPDTQSKLHLYRMNCHQSLRMYDEALSDAEALKKVHANHGLDRDETLASVNTSIESIKEAKETELLDRENTERSKAGDDGYNGPLL